MSRIHQLYCTHCPPTGPDPGQDRQGFSNPGGYGIRASSLEGEDLRRRYEQVEPHLYYGLPRDVPEEARTQFDTARAPQRMVFVPSEEGHDALALISYRRVETDGDSTSNFAHVLLNHAAESHTWWSNLTCLQLWGAPRWVKEDSDGLPTVLESLSDLNEVLGDRPPLVSQDLVLKFLTAPVGDDWGEGAAIVPRRWRKMPAEQRCELFTITFSGFLAAGGKLLLVAEPSIAALWFYAMLRLLPNIPLFAEMGFSTFEPHVRSLRVPLAATCFARPATTDLARKLYCDPRFAMNTFRKRCSRAFVGEGFYGSFMVDRLVRYGWDAVKRFLVRLQVGGAKTVEDLEAMSARLGGVQSP